MKELLKSVILAVAAPVATEIAGAIREARAKEHDAAIEARKALASLRGASEPGR
ncbi:MAG: hypothetical protein Q8S73_37015 [Deltaproteobacteria bacterium]|nr:hypothetical protein [Myxococcales bacterium]MDP3219762.1 hypothetical protein [Deltaproteobacteria bacterium]